MAEEKREYVLTDAPDRTKDQEKQEELNIPAYMTQVDLDNDQKERLSKDYFNEKEAIDKEWAEAGLIDKFDSLDNQYEGKMEENEDTQFSLHKHTTKVKVDTATRYSKKAFLKSDPVFSISPRPEYLKEGGLEVCEHQQEYLDYKLDEGEIPFKGPLGKAIHSAGVKGVGILKIPHEIKREKCKREEVYTGTPVYALQIPTQQGAKTISLEQDKFKELEKENPQLAKQAKLVSNKGLDDFMKAYPEAIKKYKGYIKKLGEGKEVRIMVEYEDVTYNDPLPKYVVLQNFRCRLSVEGYEGMKTTKLLSERMSYTWWELKKEETAGKFFDIDDLKYKYTDGKRQKKGNKEIEKEDYETETFDVDEAVFYWKIKADDDEETKIRFWIEVDSKRIIGITLYPYYGVPCYYVPFYVLDKWAGWVQPGLAEYLTDINLAENAFLNFSLEAMWMRNMITPITKEGTAADIQFLEKEFAHGIPINSDPNEIDFLQRHMAQIDTRGLIAMMQVLTRGGDDVSGITSSVTGGESQIDPDAPAKKTLALLKQSGINIEEYIENLLPSFNEVGKIILQLTYQMSKQGRKYKPKGKGANFSEISRHEMIARTNIQSQAMSFNFDELNLKRELLAFYQMFRPDPLLKRNPEAWYVIMKATIKHWSPMFRNLVDEILPPIEEFKKGQLQIAIQAVSAYVSQVVKEANLTRTPPEFDPKQLMQIIQQMTQEAVTPPSKEQVTAREKEAKVATR